MVVSYSTTGDWTDSIPKTEPGEFIVAIFVANSDNMLAQTEMTLEDYIRGSEKADHKAWDDWVIPGGNPQIIQRIKRGVRKKIKDDYPSMTVGSEEKKNLGLGKMLADMILPPTDFVYWDDAVGGTSGPGGTGGDGTTASGGGLSVNNSAHVVLRQMGALRFGEKEIELPVRILFGKKRFASLEMVVDAEGHAISCEEWEKTFDTVFPISLNGFKITHASKGKGSNENVLIGADTDITNDIKICGIDFRFENAEKSGEKMKVRIETDNADDYIIDGVIKYTISDVQGTLVLKEEA